MKFLATLIASMTAPSAEGNVKTLLRLVGVMVAAVVLFSAGFHWIMALEGREFSWLTSFYWTAVTMTTLGYGDIVFESDLGRLYTLLVLIVGAVLILIMLPFTFIQLVYLPWQAATRLARTPREVPEGTADHVILTALDPMNDALIQRLRATGVPYVLVVGDADEAIALHDRGYRVAVGGLDDPDTYRRIRADRAAMLFTSQNDRANTNATFTMREVTDRAVIVATANSEDAVDILQLAGCDRVLRLGELLGREFSRRILGPTARSRAVARFDDLVIAEAAAAGTSFEGRSVRELDLRARFGVSIVGLWNRGVLEPPAPDVVIASSSVVLLAGTVEQLRAYDEAFARDPAPPAAEEDDGHVVILGGGRVGRATATALEAAGTSCTIVEMRAERERLGHRYVIGDAEDIDVLKEAGIEEATAVVVTTHDDDTNVYLTLYARRLRPDALVLGRVNLDRNLTTMHRAGADFVLSYASTGATEVWNTLQPDSMVMIAEELVVFRVPVPARLAGRSLGELEIPAQSGCSVIGLMRSERGVTDLDPDVPLPADADLVLVGDEAAEERFFERYVAPQQVRGWRRLLSAWADPVTSRAGRPSGRPSA